MSQWRGRNRFARLAIQGKRGPSCFVKRKTIAEALCRMVREVVGPGHVADETIRDAFVRCGASSDDEALDKLVYRYRQLGLSSQVTSMGYRQSRPQLATPGQPVPEGEPVYRSKWELSVARSLTRLGIAFSYECESFTYPGRDHRTHRYTPDFRLDDFTDTFVEVKGPNGPDSVDELKMQRVLKRHPRLTLLLWDADVVEFIEDIAEPMFVVQLITTTRLAAA